MASAVGAVGRSAVFAVAQSGARVIAGVRGKRVNAARQLPGVSEAIAIDDDTEIDRLGPLDSVADTIGGKLADKALAKVKPGGTYGCFHSETRKTLGFILPSTLLTFSRQSTPLRPCTTLRRYATAR